MNYYLVDYENIKLNSLDPLLLEDISAGDTVTIFYTETCQKINIEFINKLMELSLNFSAFKARTGSKDSLDFQLVTHLGYLIGSNGDNSGNRYFIISNDKGYDCICAYWGDKGVEVKRVSVSTAKKEEPKKVEAKPKSKSKAKESEKSKAKDINLATIEEINEVLPDSPDAEAILEIFNSFKTKTAINNGLNKKFKDTKKGSEIYKKLKPLLKSKGKT